MLVCPVVSKKLTHTDRQTHTHTELAPYCVAKVSYYIFHVKCCTYQDSNVIKNVIKSNCTKLKSRNFNDNDNNKKRIINQIQLNFKLQLLPLCCVIQVTPERVCTKVVL